MRVKTLTEYGHLHENGNGYSQEWFQRNLKCRRGIIAVNYDTIIQTRIVLRTREQENSVQGYLIKDAGLNLYMACCLSCYKYLETF